MISKAPVMLEPVTHSIIWLEDALAQRPEVVGGKAATLSRLEAEYPVPPGFCVVLESQLELDEGLRADLESSYAELSKRCGVNDVPVAVRSSALGEDSRGASFAGQYETLLNVQGKEALFTATERCALSAVSPRALAYRTQRGLERESAFTVLVQRLVVADVSAVAFSLNPITGAQDEVLINARWGLGESIVSGLVTPDSFTVRKGDRLITSSHVAKKEWMTVLTARGAGQVAVPREMQDVPSLSEGQVVEIAELCTALETRFGFPVDLECSYQSGRLFLLQCRPVTVF